MNQMVNEFSTLEKLNEINDAIDSGDFATVKDKVMLLKDEYQRICDEFDKWADEQSKINEEIEAGQLELQEAYLPNHGTNQ